MYKQVDYIRNFNALILNFKFLLKLGTSNCCSTYLLFRTSSCSSCDSTWRVFTLLYTYTYVFIYLFMLCIFLGMYLGVAQASRPAYTVYRAVSTRYGWFRRTVRQTFSCCVYLNNSSRVYTHRRYNHLRI